MFRRPQSAHPPGHTLLVPCGSWSVLAAQERLASTLFIAALLHGVVILGVTFTGEPATRQPAATSLEVVIVTRDYERRVAPLDPALLAEQNLLGRGNAAYPERLRTALPALPATRPELATPQPGTGNEPGTAGDPDTARALLSTTGQGQTAIRRAEQGATAASARDLPLMTTADRTELLAEAADVTRIPDLHPRELLVSANTRESSIAGYLNAWKTRVERIGTLNFPRMARFTHLEVHPVLEVAIGADGSLRDVVVRNSSGYRNVDQAAMDILRIAAPFEPFPQQLREDYDVLRFAYEWHFGDGVGRVGEVSGS